MNKLIEHGHHKLILLILTITLNQAPIIKPRLWEMRTINQQMNVNIPNLVQSNGCPVIK